MGNKKNKMKKLKYLVKEFLERDEYKLYRERKHRAIAIWNMMWYIQKVSPQPLTERDFMVFGFKRIQTINRLINWVQANYPHLRGLDYGEKKKLQQKVMVDLEYSPGIDNQIKNLKKVGMVDFGSWDESNNPSNPAFGI